MVLIFLGVLPGVFPGGRVTLYHKSKVELYADNVHAEGLISRTTAYLDRARIIVKERREVLRNRVDKLHLRIHLPLEHKVRYNNLCRVLVCGLFSTL